MKKNTNHYMRVYHRYLGFFLAGIMAIYASSGILLIFRNTDFLKKEHKIAKTLPAGLEPEKIGEHLGIRRFNVEKQEGALIYFKDGQYNSQTGEAVHIKKELPFLIKKLNHLHKARYGDPLFFMNIFFGASLLFFVVSAFWMFLPATSTFKKCLYFSLAGMVLAMLMVYFG